MRKYLVSFILPVFCLIATLGKADAAASPWVDVDGASLRLIVNDSPEPDGVLRGALQIDLEPGWKTYWRDPGDAGVPPSITITGSTNVEAVTVGFPAPHRFTDEYSSWAGYKEPVSFPLSFTVTDAKKPARLEVPVFLGICEKICIPVQTSFSLETNPSIVEDEEGVKEAFATLPGAASAAFGLGAAHLDGDALVVRAALPNDVSEAELFVAGDNDWVFDVPQRISLPDGATGFRIEILDRPAAGGGLAPYTLVTGERSVEGRLQLP